MVSGNTPPARFEKMPDEDESIESTSSVHMISTSIILPPPSEGISDDALNNVTPSDPREKNLARTVREQADIISALQAEREHLRSEQRKAEVFWKEHVDTVLLLEQHVNRNDELIAADQASQAKIFKLKVDLTNAYRTKKATQDQLEKVSGELGGTKNRLRDLQTKYNSAVDTIESLHAENAANARTTEQLVQGHTLLESELDVAKSQLESQCDKISTLKDEVARLTREKGKCNDDNRNEMPTTKEDAASVEMLANKGRFAAFRRH